MNWRRSDAVRRTLAGTAVALAAVTASAGTANAVPSAVPSGSSVAIQQSGDEGWVGPFFTRWSCEVVLASTIPPDGNVCHFNPSPPLTTLGWYYQIP
ncbi:hypothetical protein [Kribbella sp. VKM Ac-2566]|uniref:hypothetical protein n=1 Tax=Kribbella sp. VKM Ac-2566 TaxID=2512218 RepID=UPI001063A495|nr:hypothetical protein [Kribbella sp. VKM Ac-2566]TDW97731.1 hypothetical protein EV647_2418 [Kribbella sp. VKM Ac-2566]